MQELKSSPGITTRMSAGVFELFCETMPVALMTVNFDGHLVWANDEFFRVVGHPEQPPGLLPVAELIHPDDRDRARAEHRRLLDTRGEVRDFPCRVVRSDGSSAELFWTLRVDASTRLLFCMARPR